MRIIWRLFVVGSGCWAAYWLFLLMMVQGMRWSDVELVLATIIVPVAVLAVILRGFQWAITATD